MTQRRAILVTGAPGSGKSTLGAELARRLGAALLDLDTATENLTAVVARLHGEDDLDDPTLAMLTRDARYETLIRLGEANLAVGLDVVLVAPFSRERRDRDAWRELCDRLAAAGGHGWLLWLRIDAEEVVRRVRQRGAGRDTAKLTGDWTASLDLTPPAVEHLELDARRDVSQLAAEVIGRLAGSRPAARH